MGDALVGLLADPGDLGLRPLADRGDVVVGLLAQLGRLVGGAGVDALDVGLGLGGEALERVGARGLGRGLHGLGQVGHELVGLAARGAAPWRRRARSRLGRVRRLVADAADRRPRRCGGAVSIMVGVSLSLCRR